MSKRRRWHTSWNYRVIRHEDGQGAYYFQIHECHYDKKADTIPNSWAAEPSHPGGDTHAELIQDWMMMARAMTLPTLEFVNGKLREITPEGDTDGS